MTPIPSSPADRAARLERAVARHDRARRELIHAQAALTLAQHAPDEGGHCPVCVEWGQTPDPGTVAAPCPAAMTAGRILGLDTPERVRAWWRDSGDQVLTEVLGEDGRVAVEHPA